MQLQVNIQAPTRADIQRILVAMCREFENGADTNSTSEFRPVVGSVTWQTVGTEAPEFPDKTEPPKKGHPPQKPQVVTSGFLRKLLPSGTKVRMIENLRGAISAENPLGKTREVAGWPSENRLSIIGGEDIPPFTINLNSAQIWYTGDTFKFVAGVHTLAAFAFVSDEN